MDSHGICNRNKEAKLPKRVIRIDGDSKMKLQIQSPGTISGKYACLSYRWGGEGNICLLRSNLKYFEENIPESQVPQLFKDVREFITRLEIEYLWIDSLCILQDDEDDWRVEAAAMADIYSNAFFTVAATCNNKCQESLFSSTPAEFQPIEIAKQDGNTVCIRRKIPHPWSHHRLDRAEQRKIFPLLSRGWVYQERLLSKRFIHFTKCEIQWECMEGKFCECRHDEDFYSKKGKTDTDELSWTSFVSEFTSYDLTMYKDNLPAMSGLAMRYNKVTKMKYLAGLWKENLTYDFNWTRHTGSRYGGANLLDARPKPRSAPTWSWASIKSMVSWIGKACQSIKFL